MAGVFRSPLTPGVTWFASAGGSAPAAGGFLLTYLAGSLTPQTTFTDSTGGVANPVPTGLPFPNQGGIVLDANGKLPASSPDLWLSGGVAYRFILWDAAGNVLADVDDIQGVNDPAFAAGNFGEWLDGPAATWLSGTSFSAQGDVVTNGPLTRDRRLEITHGGGVSYATLVTAVFSGTLTTVTFTVDDGSAAVTAPITGLRYGVLSAPNPSLPPAAIILGAPRRRTVGNSNVLLYGPIGSNLVTFVNPPDVVASAGGAGNQVVTGTVNGVAGSLTFNKTAHGRVTGQAVQVGTSAALPGNVSAVTTYIVFVVDANNYGLYAVPSGWQFEQPYLDPLTNPGGLTWGNPVAFSSAGTGNQTVTPGYVVPTGITRIWVEVDGAGGGSAGVAAVNAAAANNITRAIGGGGGGGGWADGWLAVTAGTWIAATVGGGGAGGAAGDNVGTAGGTTNFSTISATGGGGGPKCGSGGGGVLGASAAGGVGSGGNRNGAGTPGGVPYLDGALVQGGVSGAVSAMAAPGGSGRRGGGGQGRFTFCAHPGNATNAGVAGQSAGGGASGAVGLSAGNSASTASAGGAGANGLVCVAW